VRDLNTEAYNYPPLMTFMLKSIDYAPLCHATFLYNRDIMAGDIMAGDIMAGDIMAGNIMAGNIMAGDIMAGDIMAGDIMAGDIASPHPRYEMQH
jgi:pentapeptide MXKDX repeat protein